MQGAAAVLSKHDYAAILAMLQHVSSDSMKVMGTLVYLTSVITHGKEGGFVDQRAVSLQMSFSSFVLFISPFGAQDQASV